LEGNGQKSAGGPGNSRNRRPSIQHAGHDGRARSETVDLDLVLGGDLGGNQELLDLEALVT
jgi:hypothetical protein